MTETHANSFGMTTPVNRDNMEPTKEFPMHQVNLNDQLYNEVQRRAMAAGFSRVDDYVADLLTQDFQRDDENLDHFFTPARLALIDQSAEDVAAGNFYSLEQVRETISQTRNAWLRDHGHAP